MPTPPPNKPAAPATPPPSPATPPATPGNRPASGEAPTGRATVGPAQTYPPGSRFSRDIPNDGPDPQVSKLRPYELTATRAQEETVLTAAQEQRERSADYEDRGVEGVKAEGDERDPRDRPRTVPGVSPTQLDADAPRRA